MEGGLPLRDHRCGWPPCSDSDEEGRAPRKTTSSFCASTSSTRLTVLFHLRVGQGLWGTCASVLRDAAVLSLRVQRPSMKGRQYPLEEEEAQTHPQGPPRGHPEGWGHRQCPPRERLQVGTCSAEKSNQ